MWHESNVYNFCNSYFQIVAKSIYGKNNGRMHHRDREVKTIATEYWQRCCQGEYKVATEYFLGGAVQ